VVPRLTRNSAIREDIYPRGATWGLLTLFATVLAVIVLSAGCGGSTQQGSSEEPGDPGGSGSQPEETQTELTQSGTPPAEDTGVPEPESTTANAGPVQVETSVVATGLEAPWGLAFLPSGEALVTERDSGRLLSLDASGNVEELQRLPEGGTGEGGLLGVALSPGYASDGLIYAYYSTESDNRVVRLGRARTPIQY
jgi:glucose/arabinose dehydrogenase